MIPAVILTWNSARYMERRRRRLDTKAHNTEIRPEVFTVGEQSEDQRPRILSASGRKVSSAKKFNQAWACGELFSRAPTVGKDGTRIYAVSLAKFCLQNNDCEKPAANMTWITSNRTFLFILLHVSDLKNVKCLI